MRPKLSATIVAVDRYPTYVDIEYTFKCNICQKIVKHEKTFNAFEELKPFEVICPLCKAIYKIGFIAEEQQ